MDGIDVRVVDIGGHIDVVRGVDIVVELDYCRDIMCDTDGNLYPLSPIAVVALKYYGLIAQRTERTGTKALAGSLAHLPRHAVGHAVVILIGTVYRVFVTTRLTAKYTCRIALAAHNTLIPFEFALGQYT